MAESNPLPYHLATPQRRAQNLSGNMVGGNKSAGRGPPAGYLDNKLVTPAFGGRSIGKQCKAGGAAAAHPGNRAPESRPSTVST